MQTLTQIAKIVGVAMFFSIAAPVFAESAPVYDADALQQDEATAEHTQAQDLPPLAPSQDVGANADASTFVPMQSQPTLTVEPGPSAAPMPAPVASSGGLEQRMHRVEQQVNNMSASDASTKVDSLQGQVQTLRGQVEQLTHQLEQMQTQQKVMLTDVDNRLTQVASNSAKSSHVAAVLTDNADMAASLTGEKPVGKSVAAKTATNSTAATKTAADQPNVAEEQQIYQTAYNLIKSKKYNDAVNALQGMLKKYPSGQFASNAHYWLGELYGLMGKNDLALNEFGVVVKTYPDSPRISDAQLKVGIILASQMKWTDAKLALKKVVNHYPGTASSRLASEQLKQIKDAGH